MKVEVFALCDAATDTHGKLNLLGTFDQIYAENVPVKHPSCTIALRLRFSKMEEGPHRVQISMMDPDGNLVFKPMEGKVVPRMAPDVESVAVNLILNLQHLQLPAFADYQIDLAVDGERIGSLPLKLRQVPPRKTSAPE